MGDIEQQAKIIWDYMLVRNELRSSDIIICLGSHDLGVAHRVAELYLAGLAPKILITGGRGKLTESNQQGEAQVYSSILRKAGVPKEVILIEDKATNTGENVEFSRKLIHDIHLDIISAIVVTKPYMERRAKATFTQLWPELNVVVASQQISYEDYVAQDALNKDDTLNVMVGDLQRIMIYPAKGWMAPQDVPVNVVKAYDYLVAAGYNHYVIGD